MDEETTISLSVSGEVTGGLYNYVDNHIVPELEKLSGVASVSILNHDHGLPFRRRCGNLLDVAQRGYLILNLRRHQFLHILWIESGDGPGGECAVHSVGCHLL